jgi:hypothetical protein
LREFITLFVHSFSHAGRRRKDTAMSGMGRGWEIAPLLRLVHRVAAIGQEATVPHRGSTF